MQNFGHPASDPLAVELPAKESPSQVAAFAMEVDDRSNTTSTCMLSAPKGADVRLTGQIDLAGLKLNQEYTCTSPQVFSTRTAGSYVFETHAVDESGNRERPPQRHTFDVAFASGAMYTQVLGDVPWGPTNKRRHTLELAAIEGTAGGSGTAAASSTGFEYAAAQLKKGEWDEGSWQPVDGSTLRWQVWRICSWPPKVLSISLPLA